MDGWGKKSGGRDGADPVRGFPDEKPFIPKAVPINACREVQDAADSGKNVPGGRPDRDRTCDPQIMSPPLYH